LAVFCKQISALILALALGSAALAQQGEPEQVNEGHQDPRTAGSFLSPNTSTSVTPNATTTGIEFADPRREEAVNQASGAIDGTSIDFRNLGVDRADLGGQNALPADLTNLETDPNALSNALGDADLTNLVNHAFDNDVGGGEFDDWVNSVMGGTTDPFEVTGLSPTTPPNSCTTTPTTRETVRRSRYSCSVDDGTHVGQPSCERVLVHPTDDDYVYECGETRPSPSDTWSGQCGPFENDESCEQTDEVCNEEVSAVPADYQCERGDSVSYSDEQCEERREYVLDPDYQYQCTRQWVRGEWVYSPECEALSNAAGCAPSGTACQTPAPPQEENYTCETVPGVAASSEQCAGTLEIELDEDYTYSCQQIWDEARAVWVDQNPDACEQMRTTCVQVQGWSCDQPGPPNLVDRFCEVGSVLVDQPETCQQDRLHEVDLDFRYEAVEVFDPVDREWDRQLAHNTLTASPHCEKTDTQCLEERDYPRVEQSCRVGFALGSEARTCLLPLEHDIDVDYVYGCERVWDPQAERFVVSSACTTLANTSSCDFMTETCTTPAPPVFEDYTCRIGDVRVERNEQVDRALRVQVDLDYIYRCYQDWDEASAQHVNDRACGILAGNATCRETSRSCTSDSPGVFSSHSCERGYRINQDTRTCRAPADVIVDVDYSYEATREWDGTTHARTFQNNRLVEHGCDLTSSRCSTSSPGVFTRHTCQAGWRNVQESRNCTRPRVVTVDADYEYRARNNWNGSRWVATAPLTTLQGNNSCTETSRRCVTQSPGVFTYHDCRTGYQDGAETRRCDRPLTVNVDADYEYEARRNWNGSAFINDAARNTLGNHSSCSQTGTRCTEQSPGVFTRHSCQTGYRHVAQNRSCERPAYVNVDSDPVYTGVRSWNGSRFVNNSALTSLQNTAHCQQTAVTCSTPSPGVFSHHSCQNGWRHNVERRSCTRDLNVSVDPDYEYRAHRNWNGSRHVNDGPRNTLGSRSDCRVTGTRCSTPSPGVFSNHSCQAGYRDRDETRRCTRARIVSVDTDYVYEGRRNWNGSRHVNDSARNTLGGQSHCARTGTRCSRTSPGVFSTYTCEQGTRPGTANRTCDEVLGVSVQRWYRYTHQYTSTSGEPTIGEGALIYTPAHSCTAMGSPLCMNMGGGSRFEGFGGQQSCTQNYRCAASRIGGVNGVELASTTSDSWNSSSCNQHSSCSQTQRQCVEGRATRTINGVAVTRDCWRYRRTYSCATSTPVNTCAPPAGAQHVRDTCLRQDGGQCGLTRREYRVPQHDPSGGCHQYTDTYRCESAVSGLSPVSTPRHETGQSWNESQCNSIQSGARSCRVTGTRCVEGAGTRTINGLSVYRSCWREERTYSCTVRDNLNTCSPPSGASLQSQTCAWRDSAGTCRLHNRNYRRQEHDPSGGCHQYEDTFRCENAVSGLQPTRTFRDETGAGWNMNQCNATQSGAVSCQLARTTCVQGAGTRNIGGLNVYKSCWRQRLEYDCTVQQTINTCSPPSGSSLQSQTCAWRDSAGTCRLHNRTYRREEHDPSGGCHAYTHTFRCENNVGGLNPNSNIREIINQGWDNNSCNSARAGAVSCSETSRTCIEGRATRTINGLPVTRNCWRQRINYSCQVRENINTCAPPSGSSVSSENCAWRDGAGVCRLFDRVYEREENDPSGGCHQWTDTFRCEGRINGLNHTRVLREVSGTSWDDSACGPARAGTQSCRLRTSRCVEGAGTRNINGLNVHQSCWKRENIYDCTVRDTTNTCSPPSGSQLIEETCVWRDSAGTCRLHDLRYRREEPDPSGGCHSFEHTFMCENQVSGLSATRTVREVTGDSWDDSSCGPAQAGAQTCTSVSNRCVQGAGTRTINGLAVHRNCWERRNVYDCTVRENINTCAPPAGSTLEEESCVWSDSSGTCRLFNRTYAREETDPSGGCHVFTDRFRCENTVGLVGQPVQTHRDIIRNNYDRSSCAQHESSNNCTRTGRRCVSGRETRTINGRAVTRDCWEQEDIYTCDVRQDINTCAAEDQFGVSSGDADENLIWGGDLSSGEALADGIRFYNSSSGSREMEAFADGTQGLAMRDRGFHEWSSGTLVSTYLDLRTGDRANGHFSVQPGDEVALGFETRNLGDTANRTYMYAQFLDVNGSRISQIVARSGYSENWSASRTQGIVPVGTVQVRIRIYTYARTGRNGSPTTFDMAMRNIWFKHAPEGFEASPQYSAPSYGDYEATSRECVWEDGAGVCRLYRYNYQREEHDPSGGCHRYDRRFLCEDYVGGISLPIETLRSISSESLDHGNEVAELEAQQCVEARRECIAGPATRTVNGLSVTRDCWQWRYFYTCEDREAFNGCAPEADCSLAEETCVDRNDDGSCMLSERRYRCESEDNSGGCHAFTSEYRCEDPLSGVGPLEREIRSASAGTFNESACASLEAEVGCVQTSVRCSDPEPTTRIVDGLEITSDCWEQERTYTCETRTPLDDCGEMTQCDLVEETCEATGADGSCATYLRQYSCEIEDGSDRCARRRVDYTCAQPVEGGGNPVSAFAASLGTAHWDQSCTVAHVPGACTVVEERCLEGPARVAVNMVVSAADLAADPELARILGLTGVSAGSGHASEIEGAGGLWQITSAMVDAYEAEIDCVRREVTYNCQVAEPVNTCGEFDPVYADQAGAGQATSVDDPMIVTTVNGTDDDNVLQGTDGSDEIYGRAGHDVIYAGGGRDYVNGGAGDDYIELGDGRAYPFRNDAGQWVNRAAEGGAGNDQIVGGPDQVYMRGGDGDDLFVIYPGLAIWSRYNGGPGSDTISYQRWESGVSIDLGSAYYDSEHTGDWRTLPGNQHIIHIENLKGSEHDDALTGDSGDNILYGLAGDDVLSGGEGVDAAVYHGASTSYSVSIIGVGAATVAGGGEGHDSLTEIEFIYFLGDAQLVPLTAPIFGGLESPRVSQCAVEHRLELCEFPPEDDPCDRMPMLCNPPVYPINLPQPPGQPSAPPPSGTMGECVFQEDACVTTGSDGTCLLSRRRYVCEISDGSGGCSTRSDLWRCETELPGGQIIDVLYTPGEQTWNWQRCESLETASRCQPVGEPYCTDDTPRSRDIGGGMEVEAECWELTQNYECAQIEASSTCDPAFTGSCAGAGAQGNASCAQDRECELASTTCEQSDFNGDCLRERHQYVCQVYDGSNGCAVAVDNYQCEGPVDGAGEPTDVVVTVDGSSWVSGNCPAANNPDSCQPAPEPTCVDDWSQPRSVTHWSWRDGEYHPFVDERVDLASITVSGCQVRERNYTCAQYTDATTCELPDESCVQVSANCAEHDQFGTCIREAISYQCTPREAGCIDRTRTFRCEDLVDGGGQPSDVITTVDDPYWEDRGCEELNDPELECQRQEPVCTVQRQTRRIGELEIFEECWEQQVPYICDGVGEVRTDCDPPDHCVQVEEVCLDDPQVGVCRSIERRYECEETVTEAVNEERCGTEITCFGGTCVEQEREQSTNMPDALARLAALGQAHETEGSTSSTLSLMSGEALGCHKSGIWKNCCSNGGGGIAVDVLGGSCSEEEQELAHRTAENQCVEVGWYCAKRGWFGCRKRRRTSCCFGSELARIVNEAGRDQLGMDWGSPSDPNCAGLTPDQFSRVDLSNVDMSSLFDDVVEGFAPDGQGSVESRIRDRLSNFYSTGSSGLGSPSGGSTPPDNGGN